MKSFTDKVLEIVGKITKGKVMSYGQVAKLAGQAKASRAVGMIMSKNKNPNIPCHRVVRADGSIGQYNGINKGRVTNKEILDLSQAKAELLKEEGVEFSKNGKVIL